MLLNHFIKWVENVNKYLLNLRIHVLIECDALNIDLVIMFNNYGYILDEYTEQEKDIQCNQNT